MKVKVTPAQHEALNARGVFEDTRDSGEELLVSRYRDWALEFDQGEREEIASIVNRLSNGADELSREEPDAERRRWLQQDARTLSNLYLSILKAGAP